LLEDNLLKINWYPGTNICLCFKNVNNSFMGNDTYHFNSWIIALIYLP
jgi:hypothetical protein